MKVKERFGNTTKKDDFVKKKMKKVFLWTLILIVTGSEFGFSQNLQVLNNKSLTVFVGFSGLEVVNTRLGFDESSVKAEINHILRGNGIKITSDYLSNISVFFTVDAIVSEYGQISYSANSTVFVKSMVSIIPEKITSEFEDKDTYLLEDISIYSHGYNGLVGESNYSQIKESLINLSYQLAEKYLEQK